VELARHGAALTLVARDLRDLEAVASDIRARFGVAVTSRQLDLAASKGGGLGFDHASDDAFDAAFVTAGWSSEADDGTLVDPAGVGALVSVNFGAIAPLLLNIFQSMKRTGRGYIGVCSSIAAPVPRTKNMVYAAAKNALESLCRSLQHAAGFSRAGDPLKVQIFRLGYVDTGLSYGQRLLFPALAPDAVARKMLYSMKGRQHIVYLPGYWRWIVLILQIMPRALFNRLRF
jgi:short-subunit dehydrogenase